MSFYRPFLSAKKPFNRPLSRKGGVYRTGKKTIVWLIGDSNTGFSQMPAPEADETVTAWQASTSSLVTAQDPLEHINWGIALVGPAVFLGKMISKNTGNDVVIVPSGQGGSGLDDGAWKDGGALYTEAVSRFNNAYAATNDVEEIIIICSIGINNVGTADYAAQLDSLVTRLRTDISHLSDNTPFILYDPNDDAQYSYGRQGIERIGNDLPNRVPYTATADLTGVRSNDDVRGDDDETHHYDMDEVAERIYAAIPVAKANASPMGTQITPQIYLSPTVQDNEDGTMQVRFPYSPIYLPVPTAQRFDIYHYDDKNFSNPVLISQHNVPVGTLSYQYTLPDVDDKYYGGEFVPINANGESRFRTSDSYQNSG